MFVNYSLIDSIIDSSFAQTADTGCDWLKQLKRFAAVLAETVEFRHSFETVLFQFHFNCADSFSQAEDVELRMRRIILRTRLTHCRSDCYLLPSPLPS